MTATKVDGRHFSKRETVTIEDLAELAEYLPIPGFAERMERFAAGARGVLENRGLPSEATVEYRVYRKAAGLWPAWIPTLGWCNLDREIARCGFARDSLEDFAARIIVTHDRWNRSTGEARDQAAYDLGQLRAMIRVYGAESATGRMGGAVADDELTAGLCRRFAELRAEGWRPTAIYRKLARESDPPLSAGAIKKRIGRAKKAGT